MPDPTPAAPDPADMTSDEIAAELAEFVANPAGPPPTVATYGSTIPVDVIERPERYDIDVDHVAGLHAMMRLFARATADRAKLVTQREEAIAPIEAWFRDRVAAPDRVIRAADDLLRRFALLQRERGTMTTHTPYGTLASRAGTKVITIDDPQAYIDQQLSPTARVIYDELRKANPTLQFTVEPDKAEIKRRATVTQGGRVIDGTTGEPMDGVVQVEHPTSVQIKASDVAPWIPNDVDGIVPAGGNVPRPSVDDDGESDVRP